MLIDFEGYDILRSKLAAARAGVEYSEWSKLTKNQRKNVKRKLRTQYQTAVPKLTQIRDNLIATYGVANYFEKEETENTMIDHRQQEIEHLTYRLRSIMFKKEQDLTERFNIVDMPAPRTFRELLDRINLLKYEIDEKDMDKKTWGNPLDLVRWRDPSKTEDLKGFEAALEKMKEVARKIEDFIQIYDGKAALEQVHNFEQQDFAA